MPTDEQIFDDWIDADPEGEGIDDLCARHPEREEALRSLWVNWRDGLAVLEVGEEPGASRVRLEGSRVTSDARGQGSRILDELRGRVDQKRYQRTSEIARGGQGIVVKVEDRNLLRTVAMKLLRSDSDRGDPKRASHLLGRFLEEAQVTAQLDHPGIPPVHEVGLSAEDEPYFTMKYVKGQDLETYLRTAPKERDGRTLARLLEILVKVCDAMSYAHSKQVLHRDLKPSNVMVGRYGEVYVMDWGLARVPGSAESKDLKAREANSTLSLVLSARRDLAGDDEESPLLTMDGDVIGTPAYMSPEQAKGELELLGPQSDVYAIGAMLYHVLVGHMPYVPPDASVNHLAIWQRLQEGPPRPVAEIAPNTPVELIAICEKAMARDLGGRYASAEELADDLRAFQEQRVVSAYARGPVAEIRMWVRRNRVLAAAMASLVLAGFVAVALGASGVVVRKERDRERERNTVLLGTYEAIDVSERLQSMNGLPVLEPGTVDEYRDFAAAIQEATTSLRGSVERLAQLDMQDEEERQAIAYLQSGLAQTLERDGPPVRSWIEQRASTGELLEEWSLTGSEVRPEWEKCLERLAGDSRFDGFELAPQLGLYPLGRDSRSGLEEFAHVASSAIRAGRPSIPRRGRDGALDLGPGDGAILVLMPGGRTRMGRRSGLEPKDELPVQEIDLEPFFIGKHELTFAQWERLSWRPSVSNYAPDELVATWYPRWLEAGFDVVDGEAGMHPVDSVSWRQASQALRLAGLDLPSEAQWEYAARGDADGRDAPWWTGEDPAAARAASNIADRATIAVGLLYPGAEENAGSDGWPMTAPVHRTHPNPFGIHGVIGNIREWCRDEFNEDGHGRPGAVDFEAGSGIRRETGQPFRVVRGGGYGLPIDFGRSANRFWQVPEFTDYSVGLRVARSVDLR